MATAPFLFGGAVAAALTEARGPRARLEALMDIGDQAATGGPTRALVFVVLDQILSEMLAQRAFAADVLGRSLDPGGVLAATIRMIAAEEIALVTRANPRLADDLPVVEGVAGRLADRLAGGLLPQTSTSLARQVLRELMGPRRLRPRSASGEIDILRTLATLLTASGDRLLTADEVQAAFVERSKSLVTADFVGQYATCFDGPMAQAEALLRLCENVTGPASKRSAARWLIAGLTSLRFESELLASQGRETPAHRLARLAEIQRGVAKVGLAEPDLAELTGTLGGLGGRLESKAGLVAALGRSPTTPVRKLVALLRMATGETAPLGAAADRAKAEALRLLRAPETRQALAETPGDIAAIRPLLKSAGLAA